MSDTFTRSFHVRWGDIDFNGHMKNTAYLDISVDVRMMFFAENGFAAREFEELKFGPVVLRDEVSYFRELKLLERMSVDLALAGLSEDGSRFRIRNQFFRPDSQLAAVVTTLGGWLNLQTRKLSRPPERLEVVLARLGRTEDYEDLPSSLRR